MRSYKQIVASFKVQASRLLRNRKTEMFPRTQTFINFHLC
jgi:hypothetical protein